MLAEKKDLLGLRMDHLSIFSVVMIAKKVNCVFTQAMQCCVLVGNVKVYSLNQCNVNKKCNVRSFFVTSHYSQANICKNTVIPEVIYRESTLSIDSC